MKRIIYLVLALITVITVSIIGTSNVKATRKQAMTEESYKEFERKYRDDVKAYLNDLGFKNSGIMLTKVIDENGKRTYTLEIHHKDFARLDCESKEEIMAKLRDMAKVTQDSDSNVIANTGEYLECKFPVSDTIIS